MSELHSSLGGQDEKNPYSPPQPIENIPLPIRPSGSAELRSPRQWRAVIRQKFRHGDSLADVRFEVVAQGLPEAEAKRYIHEELLTLKKSAKKMTFIGVVISLIGVIITAFSFLQAVEQPKGTFLIWYGPIITGLVFFLLGLARYVRFTRLQSFQ